MVISLECKINGCLGDGQFGKNVGGGTWHLFKNIINAFKLIGSQFKALEVSKVQAKVKAVVDGNVGNMANIIVTEVDGERLPNNDDS